MVVDAVERRYSADYDVVEVDAASGLTGALQTLAGAGRAVALVLAPLRGGGAAGLGSVHDHCPTARRIAIVGVGDTSVAAELNRAITLDAVDYYVGHGTAAVASAPLWGASR